MKLLNNHPNKLVAFVFRVVLGFCVALGITQVSIADNAPISTHKFQLEVSALSVTKESESGGDEVYLSIVEYSNYGKSSYFRVPSYPTYWLAKHLKSVKKVRLWEHEFSNGEATQLIVSIVERDLPPWNVDDLIGAIKINLHQKDGALIVEWDPHHFQNEAKVDEKEPGKPVFVLNGNDSVYEISFDTIIERINEKS
ncbi:MAG: hypothetical protein HON32_09975 [Francisellaceae bacterium]|nr:hypothetical protein [Francisellaceae bacterium]